MADDVPVVAVAADRVDHQQLRQIGAARLQRPEVEEGVLHLPEPRRRHAAQRHRRRQRRDRVSTSPASASAGVVPTLTSPLRSKAVPVERPAAVLARRERPLVERVGARAGGEGEGVLHPLALPACSSASGWLNSSSTHAVQPRTRRGPRRRRRARSASRCRAGRCRAAWPSAARSRRPSRARPATRRR